MEFILPIYNKEFTDQDLLNLKSAFSELAYDLDVLYTETAPNGNISARIGRIAIYSTGSGYEMWQNTDGETTWAQMSTSTDLTDAIATCVLLTGDQTVAGIKTFSSIPVLPASDPMTDNQAVRKSYVDDNFDTTDGHDHDGTDSKKVLIDNIDTTGGTSGQIWKANGSGGGSWDSLEKGYKLVDLDTVTSTGTQTVTFSGLDSSKIYRLLIPSYYVSGIWINSKTAGNIYRIGAGYTSNTNSSEIALTNIYGLFDLQFNPVDIEVSGLKQIVSVTGKYMHNSTGSYAVEQVFFLFGHTNPAAPSGDVDLSSIIVDVSISNSGPTVYLYLYELAQSI